MQRLMLKSKLILRTNLLRLNYKNIVILITIFFYSCSNSTQSCKVTSFRILNILYDELKFIPFDSDGKFTEKINLEYDGDKIIKTHGGLRNMLPPGSSFPYHFGFSNDVVENITYNGNTITVTTLNLYTKEFVINNDKLVSQSTTYSNWVQFLDFVDFSSGLHLYEYNGNEVIEKKNGFTRRVFYLEGGNLIKVDWFILNYNTGEIYKKYEYLFSEYDNTPNRLKGKFFINGNFFKAFSKNNYKKFEMKSYNYVDGIYQLNNHDYHMESLNFIPSDMFAQECE